MRIVRETRKLKATKDELMGDNNYNNYNNNHN